MQTASGRLLPQLLEALLFVKGEPVALSDLQRWLRLPSEQAVRATVAQLAQRLEASQSALTVRWVDGGVELCTRPELDDHLRVALEPDPRPLSHAAWETLAVVAYRQPITRAEIEAVRGVSCERALATLLERELVEEVGRKAAPGRPLLYATTARFLREFGLQSLQELPPLEG
jgi:segregation and condensation protein B